MLGRDLAAALATGEAEVAGGLVGEAGGMTGARLVKRTDVAATPTATT